MRFTTPLACMLLLIVVACSPVVTSADNAKSYPDYTNTYSSSTIKNLKTSNISTGSFNVVGYVVKVYECPPCPKGAFCKPCMRDNIVISENNKLLDFYSLTDAEIIIFVHEPRQFVLGKKYEFSIRITDQKSTSESINDIELIGYSLVD